MSEIETLRAEIARLASERAVVANFHRSLCDRFGYTHDPLHWRRDLVSLEEHIAAAIERAHVEAKDLRAEVDRLTQERDRAREALERVQREQAHYDSRACEAHQPRWGDGDIVTTAGEATCPFCDVQRLTQERDELAAWRQGAEAALTIAQPPNSGGHTEAVYYAHRARFEAEMHGDSPYCAAADAVAVAIKRLTRERDEAEDAACEGCARAERELAAARAQITCYDERDITARGPAAEDAHVTVDELRHALDALAWALEGR